MKRKSFLFWLVLGVIVLIALNLPLPASRALKSASRDALVPLQDLFGSYAGRLRRAGDAIRGWGGLPEQNQALQEEILLLRQQLLEMEDLTRENLLLRQQLGFARRESRRLIAGSVITRDISGWWHTLRIRHAGSPLVQPNLAAVTPDGLAGRVVEVSGRSADILLLSDPACRVSVKIGEKAAHGILSGQGMSPRGQVLLRLALINKNIRIDRGDEVFTSGLGGIFPAGIRVGTIESVALDENGLHQSAEVKPAVDLGDLQVLFVVAGDGEDAL